MTDKIDYEAWKFWFSVLQLVGTILIGVYVWWTNRVKINNKRFVALEKTVAEKATTDDVLVLLEKITPDCVRHQAQTRKLEDTVHGLEVELRHMPSRIEIQDLNSGITTLTEKIGKLDGQFAGVNRAVDLMNQFLINQGGKA